MNKSRSTQRSDLERAMRFLRELGLEVHEGRDVDGFLNRTVRITRGALEVTARCHVSDLLHEAGHLAILPAQFRHLADGDLEAVEQAMSEAIESLEPDSPLARAILQCSDPEATAWNWAAGMHLGLPAESVIRDHQFDGDGAAVRGALGFRAHLGIHGLAHAGFCAIRPGRLAAAQNKPAFPNLAYWLQPDLSSALEPRHRSLAQPAEANTGEMFGGP